jgi:hypothetical protein
VDEGQKYQRYQEDFDCGSFAAFRVLFLTTSEKRLENMRQSVSQLAFHRGQAKRWIWLATFDQITSETVFEEIWRSADADDERSYQIG